MEEIFEISNTNEKRLRKQENQHHFQSATFTATITTTMLVQAHSFRPSPAFLFHSHRQNPIISRPLHFNVSWLNGVAKWQSRRSKCRVMRVSASEEQSSSFNVGKNRKVVEHLSLLKTKEDLSDEEEKDMLDFLYTTQYQMGGILSISLGRISNQNAENYSHAVYMRFQRKDDLEKFYEKPFYLGVLKKHVFPYCHVCPDMDYLMWIMNLK